MTTNGAVPVQPTTSTDDHESLVLVQLPELSVEGIVFPSTTLIQNTHDHAAAAAGSSKTLALAGAGVRGIPIEGKFVKFTVIGVYVEAEEAVKSLAGKWKGKSADELYASVDFFMDIVKGSYDKFTRVTMILPLTGAQYSEKVTENCVAYWKSSGVYTEAEENAVAKFKQTFKDQNFPPGSSILFTHSSSGSLTIAFSKDSSVPEKPEVVIENKAITEAMLESIIGKHGVSPEAKRSLAERLCEMIKLINPDAAAAKDDVLLIKEHEAVNGDVKEITVTN